MSDLTINGKYKFVGQPEILVYIGHNFSGNGYWHQFEKAGNPGVVWCEIQPSEFNLIEKTIENE